MASHRISLVTSYIYIYIALYNNGEEQRGMNYNDGIFIYLDSIFPLFFLLYDRIKKIYKDVYTYGQLTFRLHL